MPGGLQGGLNSHDINSLLIISLKGRIKVFVKDKLHRRTFSVLKKFHLVSVRELYSVIENLSPPTSKMAYEQNPRGLFRSVSNVFDIFPLILAPSLESNQLRQEQASFFLKVARQYLVQCVEILQFLNPIYFHISLHRSTVRDQ